MAPLNDVLKAQVKHNDALLQLQQAQHGQTLAGMNLCRLIGLDLNTSLELTDTLSGTITPGILSLPDDLSQRPDYNMLEKQVEMKQKEVNITRSDFLPQVGVTAGYSLSLIHISVRRITPTCNVGTGRDSCIWIRILLS